jgi:hypothetical protein
MELPTIRPEVFGALSVAARHRRTIMNYCGGIRLRWRRDPVIRKHILKVQKLERRAVVLACKKNLFGEES